MRDIKEEAVDFVWTKQVVMREKELRCRERMYSSTSEGHSKIEHWHFASFHHLPDRLSYTPFAMVDVIDRPLCRVVGTRSGLDRGTLTQLAPAPQNGQRTVDELVEG
jgi:hypothetical protein